MSIIKPVLILNVCTLSFTSRKKAVIFVSLEFNKEKNKIKAVHILFHDTS